LPICARDTGIYLGFFISFLFLWFTYRKRENELPSRGVLIAVFLAIGALVTDGVLSYLGLRETTNTIRLLTGLMSGFALPLLLFPVLNYQIWRHSSYESILRKGWHKIGLILILILTFAVIQIVQIFRIPLAAEIISLLIVLSIFFTFIIINFILLTLLPFWYQKANNFAQPIIPLFIALTLTVLELSLSFLAHKFLISLAL
jgi:uncharacterized membrane protein